MGGLLGEQVRLGGPLGVDPIRGGLRRPALEPLPELVDVELFSVVITGLKLHAEALGLFLHRHGQAAGVVRLALGVDGALLGGGQFLRDGLQLLGHGSELRGTSFGGILGVAHEAHHVLHLPPPGLAWGRRGRRALLSIVSIISILSCVSGFRFNAGGFPHLVQGDTLSQLGGDEVAAFDGVLEQDDARSSLCGASFGLSTRALALFKLHGVIGRALGVDLGLPPRRLFDPGRRPFRARGVLSKRLDLDLQVLVFDRQLLVALLQLLGQLAAERDVAAHAALCLGHLEPGRHRLDLFLECRRLDGRLFVRLSLGVFLGRLDLLLDERRVCQLRQPRHLGVGRLHPRLHLLLLALECLQ